MDMQESKPTIKKTTPPSEWFKNVVKSIGYTSSEVISSVTPNIHAFVGDNTSYAKELVDNVRESREQSKSVLEMINLGKQGDIAKTALKNALDDIKSGKIYNKERAEAFDDDDEFGAFMMGMEDGSLSGDSSSSGETKIINNVKIVKDDSPKLVATLEAAANANMKGTEAMLKQGAKTAAVSMSLNHELAMGITKGLETVNSNIAQLVNFQNDSMAKYVGASIKYYDESLTVMKSSLDKLIAMTPAANETANEKINPYEAIFGGNIFSLEGYVKNVKSNYETMKDDNQIVQMIASILDDDTSHLERLAKSPLTFVADAVTKKIIPNVIRNTMGQIDQTVTAFLPAMLDKFSRMGKGGNMIQEFFGRLLGVDTSVKSAPNMSNYMRGALPFDGETKRAITDIIPTYLRKIHAQLAGTKEVVFDYETGKWSELSEMQKNYDAARRGTVRAGYGDQVSELEEMMAGVKFESLKQQEEFKNGMDELLVRLARTTESIAFDKTTPEREAVNRRKMNELYSFGDPKLDDLMFSMLNTLSKTDQMNLVGSGRYKSVDSMRQFIKQIEQNPTAFNAMTLMSGLKFDDHVEVDADGKVKKVKNGKGIGNRVDKYGKDDLFYLRGIMNTLLEGIVVTTTSDGAGGNTNFSNRLTEFQGHKVAKENKVQSTTLIDYDKEKATANSEILMGDIEMGDDLSDKLKERMKHSKMLNEKAAKERGPFGDLLGSKNTSKLSEAIDNLISKPADLLQTVFNKIDGTLYNIVFGIDNGKGSFMHLTMDRMTEMFAKVGDFATEKIFLPVAEFMSKMYTKGANAVKENPIVQGIKDGVKYWFVGDKDEQGNRKGGIFSDLMNSTKDTVKSISHSITGVEYTDSQGKTHAKKEDSVFGQMKGLVKDIFGETKKHFFGDKDSNDPDKRRGMMTAVTDTLGNGMADWATVLFGKERDPNKTGSEILKQNTTQFVKAAPKGLMGAAGGLAAGTALASGFGILGSFLFPGAPLALALAGGALGMATGFEGFNKWAFGEIGGNGKRIGGALISANTKQFIKDNKTKLVGGAVGGVLASMAIPAIVDMIIPGGGAIANMLTPFGPIGAAIQGIGTAFVMKSDTVMSWLFGAKNLDGERMGGMISRLFKRSGDETSKRSVKSKLGLAAIGIAGGAILSSMTGMGLGAALSGMGVIGAMVASPFGPVGGAILGLSAAIALGSDRVRTMLFGKKDDDSDIQDIGFIGRMFNMVKLEVFEPMKNNMIGLIDSTVNWFNNKFMADLAFVTEPIIKGIKDTITGSMKAFKGVLWDLPKFLVKGTTNIISGAIGKIRDSIKDTMIEKAIIKPAGAMVKGAANLIVRPLTFFANTTMNAAVGLAKAGETVQNGLLMVPALLKMGFDRTFETTKSLFKGIGKLFKRSDEDGMNRSFGSRAKDWWSTARAEGRENSSYVTTLFENRRNQLDKYKEEKERIRGEKKQRKADWKEIAKAARDNRYNTDGLLNMSEENVSVANALKVTSRKQVKDREIIDKFQVDVFKATGLTLGQILQVNPNKPIESLSRNQLKYVDMILKRSKKKGLRGDELKKDQGIKDYQMQEIDLAEGTYDETKKIRTAIEGLAEGLGKVINNDTLRINLTQVSSKAMEEIAGANAGNSTADYDHLINQYANTGVNAQQVLHPFQNISFDTGRKPYEEESKGGAIGGAIRNATRSMTTTLMGGMSKEVSKLGCGAIVLSKVLTEAGIKMSANDIYKLAEEKGLLNQGVGISSNVFKMVASLKGLSYAFSKPTNQALTSLFAKTNMVIARLNTGVGHYVILHSFSANDNSLAIDDPMGKVSGVYDIDKVVKMSTHFYVVYRRGTGSIVKTLSGGAGSSEVSVGGSIGSVGTMQGTIMPGTKSANLVNKLKVDSSMSNIIKMTGVTPVVVLKTKADVEAEEKDEAPRGGGDARRVIEEDAQLSFKKVDDRYPQLNRINGLINLVATIGGAVSRGGRWVLDKTKGLFALRNKENRDKAKEKIRQARDRAEGKGRNLITRGLVTAAKGPAFVVGAALRGVGKLAMGLARGTKRVVTALGGGRRIASKVGQALVQMGDTASSGNISALGGGSSSTAAMDPLAGVDPEKLDVNTFLKKQTEKAAAGIEARFRSSSVDLASRTELNTRFAAQLLDDLYALHNKFFDWMKPFLEKLESNLSDAISSMDGGGGGGFDIGDGDDTTVKLRPLVAGKTFDRDYRKQLEKIKVEQQEANRFLKTISGAAGKLVAEAVETNSELKKMNTTLRSILKCVCVPDIDIDGRKKKTTTTSKPQKPLALPAPKGQKPLLLPEPKNQKPQKPLALPAPKQKTRDLEKGSDGVYRPTEKPVKSIPVPEDPVASKKNTGKREIIDADFVEMSDSSKDTKATGGKKARRQKAFTDFKDAMMGRKVGIAAGADAMDDIAKAGKNIAGKAGGLLKGAGKVAGKAGGLLKGAGRVAGAVAKGTVKTAAKVGGSALTGGAMLAGFAAVDAAYGYKNADQILKKDESEVTKADRNAASISQATFGFIPFVDALDEVLGGHGKKWMAETILGLDKVWEGVKGIFVSAGEKITDFKDKIVNSVKEGFTKAVTKVGDWFVSAGDTIKTAATEAFTKTREWFSKITTAVGDWFVGTGAKVKELATTAVENVKEGFNKVVEKVVEMAQKARDITVTIKEGIVTKFTEMKENLITNVANIKAKTVEIWTNVKTGVVNKFNETKEKIIAKLKEIVNSALSKWTEIKTGIANKFTETKDKVVGKLKEIVSDVGTKWNSIKSAVGTKWDEIKDAIPKKISEIKDSIVKKLGGIKISFAGLAADIASKVKEKITSGIGKLKVKIFGSGETVSLRGEKVEEEKKDKKPAKGFGNGPKQSKPNKVEELLNSSDSTYGAGSGCKSCVDNDKEHARIDRTMGRGKADQDSKIKYDSKGNAVSATGVYANGGVSGAGPSTNNIDGAYYSQKDARWSGETLAGSTSFGSAGCGPTAIANVVTDLTGEKVLPTEALGFAQSKGMVDPNLGTSSDLFGAFASAKGVRVNETTADTSNIQNQLMRGNKVILRGQSGSNYTSAGHYIIADGMTSDGKVKIKDPLGKHRSGTFSMSQVSQGLTNAFVASGPGTFGQGIPDLDMARSAFGLGVNAEEFIKFGQKYLGLRYVYGGKSLTSGIDCSGFTHAVVKNVANVDISHGSMNQWSNSKTLADVAPEDVCVGDLVFFNGTIPGRGSGTSHVAFVSGDNQMLEAGGGNNGGKVRFNQLDSSYWKPKIMGYRRVVGVTPGKKAKVPTKINTSRNKTLATNNTPSSGIATALAGASAITSGNMAPNWITNLGSTISAATNHIFFGGSKDAIGAALAGTSLTGAAVSAATSGTEEDLANTSFNPTGNKKTFIDKVKPGAIKSWEKYKVLPSLTIGQAAGESGWGKNSIGNNIFGVKKGSNWNGKTKWVWTHEWKNGKKVPVYAEFRDYDSIDASIEDHAKLLTLPRYKKVLQAKNYKEAVKAVREAGYATDPEYVKLITSVIEDNGLMQIDKQIGAGQYGKGIGGKATFAKGTGAITMPKSLEANNIYNIMKKSDGSSFGMGVNIAKQKENKKLFGKGCGCSGKGCGPKVSKSNTSTSKVQTQGLGSIGHITEENVRLHDHTVRNERVQNISSTNMNVFGSGTNDAWNPENVARAIAALETIAENTDGVKEGINNVTAYVGNDNSSSPVVVQSPGQAKSEPQRGFNEQQYIRNKKILAGRK